MKKYAHEISIYTKDSEVILEQPIPYEEPDRINLTLSQVDIVIKWLIEAKKELIGGEK